MKVVTAAIPVPVTARAGAWSRAADYLELTRPGLSLLVLFTVAIGAVLASGFAVDLLRLWHTLFGTALVAAGASALNQFLERHSDSRMRRTQRRPLPAGRLQPAEVLLFGLGMGLTGIVYLAVLLPEPGAALVAALTFVSYVLIYTPLKRLTTLNTLAGAVSGALPPVIGWVAMRPSVNLEAAALFLILFLWQVPHFLAIAWIHREDYTRAGLRMLPNDDRSGRLTGCYMVTYCLTLIAVSLLPAVCGGAGWLYVAGALVVGLMFLASTVGFLRTASVARARRVLRASLLYLPVLLALLLLDAAVRPLAPFSWL